MDQERFDDLARGLATGRLSRWGLLKGIAAGTALAFTGSLSPWRTSVAAAAVPCTGTAAVQQCKADARVDSQEYLKTCRQTALLVHCIGGIPNPRPPEFDTCRAAIAACEANANRFFLEAAKRCENQQCCPRGQNCGLVCSNGFCCPAGQKGCNGACCNPSNCEDCINGTCTGGCQPPAVCSQVPGAPLPLRQCLCPDDELACGGANCCDPSQCETCVNGTCQGCSSPKTCNAASGQCECPNQQSCAPPRIFDPETCECKCPDQSCGPPWVLNPDTCDCECPIEECPEGQSMDYERCECKGACEPCEELTDQGCVPVDCGDPCLECRNGQCRPVSCGDPCLKCLNGRCVPKEPKDCPEGKFFNPNTCLCEDCPDCEDPCRECRDGELCVTVDCGSPCLECVDGACVPRCRQAPCLECRETALGGWGCHDTCGDCSYCYDENGCKSTCEDDEFCCRVWYGPNSTVACCGPGTVCIGEWKSPYGPCWPIGTSPPEDA